jgi:DNA-binding beta-propeller fold protein YncE
MALNTVAAGRAWVYSHNIGRNAGAGMGFAQPVGVAPAKDGVLFVVSRGSDTNPSQRVSKVTVDQEFITEFGSGGVAYAMTDPSEMAEPGKFVWITSVALDQDENVYVSDEWLHRITVFDKDGNLLKTWGEPGEGEGQLNGPSGLAFDPNNNLYVVNSLNSRVQKFTRDGQYLGGFGKKGGGEGELDMPWGIGIDAKGDVYVADWNNHRVQKFSSDGTLLKTFGHGGTGSGSLRHPASVAIDGDGDVYVVDWMNERVVIYNADAKPLTYLRGDAVELSKWGQLSLAANPDMQARRRQVYDLEEQQRKFRMPTGCAFDRATNRLIVCDSQRGRLQVYEKDKKYQEAQFNL